MSPIWPIYLPALMVAVALVISLITGKAFNPLDGRRATLVNRVDQPTQYWFCIAMCVVSLAFCWWGAAAVEGK